MLCCSYLPSILGRPCVPGSQRCGSLSDPVSPPVASKFSLLQLKVMCRSFLPHSPKLGNSNSLRLGLCFPFLLQGYRVLFSYFFYPLAITGLHLEVFEMGVTRFAAPLPVAQCYFPHVEEGSWSCPVAFSQGWTLPSYRDPWSFCPYGVWGLTLWHMDTFWFTNLEAIQTPSFVVFFFFFPGGFITKPRLIKSLAISD